MNLLLSIAAENEGQTGLAEKYKSIGLLEQMRTLGKVPDAGIRGRAPGSQMPEHRQERPEGEQPAEGEEEQEKPEQAPAFDGHRLTEEEENNVYMELGEMLLDKSLCQLSKSVLERVTDQNSVRVMFALAKARMLLLEYSQAADDLQTIIGDIDPQMIDAHVMFGHCQYMLDNLDAAKDSYINAIRLANL